MDPILQKYKYFLKSHSASAIDENVRITLNAAPLIARDIWLDTTWMDSSIVGLGLLNMLTPSELTPLTMAFDASMATINEMMQGIWVKFTPVDFSALFSFLADLNEYVLENFKEIFQPGALFKSFGKAYYGTSYYGLALYDPTIGREYLRSSIYRLRIIRRNDNSFLETMEFTGRLSNVVDVSKDITYNRMVLIRAAASFSFVLGIGVLGSSRLSRAQGPFTTITVMTSDGRIYDVKFRTLDHLQFGFILGVTHLGYGYLLPVDGVYQLKGGKKNPPIIDVITWKARKITRTIGFVPWAYANYNKPEEMNDWHRSQKTALYDQLMSDRRFIESWVEKRIPANEANPVRLNQYKRAVLQLISWKAKRHTWGHEAWEAMTEVRFKEWWLENWKRQGLNESTLNELYEGVKSWLSTLRRRKVELGSLVQRMRKTLAQLQG